MFDTVCGMHTVMDIWLWEYDIPVCIPSKGKNVGKGGSVGAGSFRSMTPKAVFGIPPGKHMVTLIRVTDDDVCSPAGSGMDSCAYDFPSVYMIFGGHFFSSVWYFQTILLYGSIQGRS